MKMGTSFAHGAIRRWRLWRDPVGYAKSIGVRMGRDCRLLGVTTSTFGSEPYLVTLGDHVTVTGGVRFITHDGGVWVFRQEYPAIDVIAPITIGDNVFIGLNTIAMPGVTIGDNCVVGAGSVVTRDIPAGSVAVGVPARVVRTIEEYKAKTLENALMIRNLPPSQKRQLLQERLGCKNDK